MDYDQAYRSTASLFGSEPEPTLVSFRDLLERSRPVLDLGCGQGRNALFLARRGITVHAIDPSEVAVETVARVAAAEDLPVETSQGSFEELTPASGAYAGVLLFGLLPILPWDTIRRLTRSLEAWVSAGGILWVTAFTTADPGFAVARVEEQERQPDLYVGPQRQVRTYLEPGQLPKVFKAWEVLHHWEGLGEEHRHGDGPLHHHGLAEGVFRKP